MISVLKYKLMKIYMIIDFIHKEFFEDIFTDEITEENDLGYFDNVFPEKLIENNLFYIDDVNEER